MDPKEAINFLELAKLSLTNAEEWIKHLSQYTHLYAYTTLEKDSAEGFHPEITKDVRLDEANLITSSIPSSGNHHTFMADIDMHCAVVPSSTPGHFHLYIDKVLTFEQYMRALSILAEVGIVQHGYAESCRIRGYGCLRLPWVNKEDELKPR